MTITGINVPANSEAQIVYSATATAYAPLNIEGSITNSISITGDGITEPIAATETVNAATAPALDIEKSLSPTIVSENGQITYTFTVTNKGNTAVTQADDIVLRDVFNPILKNIGVTYNGTVLSNTGYTYNEATGVFETRSTCGNICDKYRRYSFSYSRYGSNYGYGQYLSKIRINAHRPLYDNQKAIDMRRYGKCRAACSLSKHKNKELRLLHRSPLLWGNIYENRR